MVELREGGWGLARARATAREVEGSRTRVKALVRLLLAEQAETRKRAADVLRRITDRSPSVLAPFADELAGALAEVPLSESRTRWHMGLVVARVAHTREQRLRAARLMEVLAEEASVVVRCSAVEGMGLLAEVEGSLRGAAEEMMVRALAGGSRAERCRAREVRRRMERAEARMGAGPGAKGA